MALIIVLAVMSGFEKDLKEKILGTNSHIIVLNYSGKGIDKYNEVVGKLKDIDGVIAATPFIYNQVMLSSDFNVTGAVIRGIEPLTESYVTEISKKIKEGNLSGLNKIDKDGIEGIIIGKELSKNIGLTYMDKINVISPLGALTPMGMMPKMKQFRIVGTFEVGMYEYDSSLALISLKSAQEFFSMGNSVTGIEVKVKDIYNVKKISKNIQNKLNAPFWTRDWMEMNKNLFSALKLEKIAMFIILVLIVLVAAFGIISNLIMMVIQKKKEIAILKSIGATKKSVMFIFIIQGIIIGIIGTIIGSIGGMLAIYLQETYKIVRLPGDVYQIDSLPMSFVFSDFILVIVSALGISFLATIYPALRASKLDPVEILRYE